MCTDYKMTNCIASKDPKPCAECAAGSDALRGTGRSQRDIVRALSQAIMGKQVLFVSMTPESGRAHWHLAIGWLQSNGFMDYPGCEVRPHADIIRMGAGRVLFSMGKSMSGPRLQGIQHIVEDHYVTECNAAAAAKKAEQEDDKNTIAKLLRKHQWTTVQSYGIQFHGGDTNKTTVRLNLLERTPE